MFLLCPGWKKHACIQSFTSSTEAKCFARLASCLRWTFLSWRASISSCFLCRVSWSCRHTETQVHTCWQKTTEGKRRSSFCLFVCYFKTLLHVSKDAPLLLLFCFDRIINDKQKSPCPAHITLPYFMYLSYIQTKNYQMVDFHRISQCRALALGDVPPQSSILCWWVPCLWRRANQAVLWRQVPLRGERRNDTSLKRHQFCWGQAAFQCGGRICRGGGLLIKCQHNTTQAMMMIFASLTCCESQCIISKVLVICIRLVHL